MTTKKHPKLKGMKLLNGKTVRPPKKGQPFGAWVEIQRRPTEAIQFLHYRGEAVCAWFYDEVDYIRILADGTREVEHRIEHIPGKIDVRDPTVSAAVLGLIRVGAAASRALCNIFRDEQEAKKAQKRPKKRAAA